MKAIYVVFSDGAESMAYLDQERGVAFSDELLKKKCQSIMTFTNIFLWHYILRTTCFLIQEINNIYGTKLFFLQGNFDML